MKENTCPNCKEAIEEGWEVCWNCQSKLPKHGATKEKKQSTTAELVKVNRQKIIDAGKQIKLVVKLTLFSVFIALIAFIAVKITDNQKLYSYAALIILFLFTIKMVNLFQAGNDLIKSVSKESKNNR